MPRGIVIRCMLDENNKDKLATEIRSSGFDTKNITDQLIMIGLLENVKNQIALNLKELARVEK